MFSTAKASKSMLEAVAQKYRVAGVVLTLATQLAAEYSTWRTQATQEDSSSHNASSVHYVQHEEPYITWLTKPEYLPLRKGLLGVTTPANRWSAVDESLSPTWRLVVAAHENMHNLRYLVGADRYLSRAQAENLNRENTEAILGPKLAPLHARLGRVPE